MSFIQHCFIRKNTPELRKKLEELGYEPCYSMVKYPEKYTNLFVSSNYGDRYFGYDDENMQIFSYEINELTKTKELIDCGTNEDLFISLAALRDDTDINQWFIMDVEEYLYINQGDWFLATDRNGGKHIGTQIDPMYCHKATVEELIEHFKNE